LLYPYSLILGDQPLATIDPIALNCHLVPAAFKNALVINGSVVSVEEKGRIFKIQADKKQKIHLAKVSIKSVY
jgi:hypothetical protein